MNDPSIRHILVAHDFTECAEPALACALELARGLKARVTILHAYAPSSSGDSPSLVADVEFDTRRETDARTALAGVARRAARAGVLVSVELRIGRPWEEIVRAAEQVHADLVVMGTHGRKGLSRALIGSIVDKVVRMAPMPVLVVPSVGARSQ